MIELPNCECFNKSENRGLRVTDSIGLETANYFMALMEESFVCSEAQDYVLVNVLAGLTLTNISTTVLRRGHGVHLADLPAIEAAGRAILAQLSDALTDRMVTIEKGLRGELNQSVNN